MNEKRRRLRLFAAAAGLTGVALLGGACGGGTNEGGAGEGGSATAAGRGDGGPSLDQQVKFAGCMREHGVDMPDPKPGRERTSIALGDVSRAELEAAMKACREVAGMPEPKGLTQKQKDEMLAFARCMREHGVDMPDPNFGDGGAAAAPARKIPKSGPERKKFEEANKACGAGVS